MRKIILKDTSNNSEFILPVTPPSFEVSHGINIEMVNIHTLGDVNLAGYGTLATIKVECMFPSKAYPFNQPGTRLDPYGYVKQFQDWCDAHTILRYIVSESIINIPVIVEEIIFGERDGTGDVYATITLRQYRALKAVQISKTGNQTRPAEKTTVTLQNYTIQRGDTLSAICRKYYGDAALYPKIASYNGIKNPNLIYTGNSLKLPDKSAL